MLLLTNRKRCFIKKYDLVLNYLNYEEFLDFLQMERVLWILFFIYPKCAPN